MLEVELGGRNGNTALLQKHLLGGCTICMSPSHSHRRGRLVSLRVSCISCSSANKFTTVGKMLPFLPARRYASAVLAVVVCVSVCVSVARRYCIETAARIELGFYRVRTALELRYTVFRYLQK